MKEGKRQIRTPLVVVLVSVAAWLSGCAPTNPTATGGPNRTAPNTAASTTSTTTTTSSTTTTTTLPPGPVMGRTAAPGRVAELTSTQGQAYSYTGNAKHTTAWAGDGPIDENIREVFWPAGTPFQLDHDVCMTWHDPATVVDRPYPQPGLALRIAPSGLDGTEVRAVTVTQNIYGGAIWIAWVDVWDSAHGTMPIGVAQFDLFPIVGVGERTMAPSWRVCGRLRGDQVAFKVWVDGPEPSWSDPSHVFTTTIPDEWVQPGYAGGYIGHLHAGRAAAFSDIEVD
ncbi:MAG TPA: hypothetical protein VFN21_04915 [Acidimicrobiales bacterium]|nr:hypothetical protein [Acidimicrobiales bacterium]